MHLWQSTLNKQEYDDLALLHIYCYHMHNIEPKMPQINEAMEVMVQLWVDVWTTQKGTFSWIPHLNAISAELIS